MPQLSTNFGDLLLPDFEEIYDSAMPHEPSMLPKIFRDIGSNGRDIAKFSSVGALPDHELFQGQVNYAEFYQGYDIVLTPLEFSQGFTVERKLYDDDQYAVYSQRPRQLKESHWRTQEKYGARIFNMGFSDDSFFYENSEGVALFSNSHTTTAPGTSTSVGFDNKIDQAFSATALETAYILASEFRGDRGEIMSINLNTILYPPNIYGEVHEVVRSAGRPDDGTNASNVHFGNYEPWMWQYLRDGSTKNWFVVDRRLMNEWLIWTDRVKAEFGAAEEFDTFVAKFRDYSRYGNCWLNWRFGIGAEVA